VAGRWRGAALVVGGVALGVGLAVGIPALSASDGGSGPTGLGRSASLDPDALLNAEREVDVAGERLRARTAREAVELFLTAEQQGDRAQSFALLSDPVRQDYGSAAAWQADPDAVPTVLGYEVEEEAPATGGAAVVVTVTRYRSSLDSVAGLVPARARTRWAAVQEDGGWAVDLDATTQEPLLPDEAGLLPAVRAFVEEQQACPEPDPALRGDTAVAAQLCGAAGDPALGPAGPLTPLDVGALQASFGGDVGVWGRVVEVTAPVALRAVLAPLDDSWQVVAVLAPPGAGR
jgi:hypothetical protein